MRIPVLIPLVLAAVAMSGSRTAGAQPPAAPAAAPPAVDAPVVELVTPTNVTVTAPDDDSGRHLEVSWETKLPEGASTVVMRRRGQPTDEVLKMSRMPKQGDIAGDWTFAYVGVENHFVDEVDGGHAYLYAVFQAIEVDGGVKSSPAALSAEVAPVASWFDTTKWGFLLLVLLTSGAVLVYIRLAKTRSKEMFIRRIAGVDAIEDAVGRSTEMGRPVLYVTGLEEIQDIQTIASLLILGHVAELTASYDTELKVANYYPLTMVVAEEVVRQGYANAGRIDAHRPENVMFITAEQFAFAAGVNGMILRDQPATNIYFGKFFGESLLLAETGFLTGAVQIAGTAELPQLPFFIAACDYTLIGEEMYATSAYLTREPTLLANLKAGDLLKLLSMIFIIVGAAVATITGLIDPSDVFDLGAKVFP